MTSKSTYSAPSSGLYDEQPRARKLIIVSKIFGVPYLIFWVVLLVRELIGSLGRGAEDIPYKLGATIGMVIMGLVFLSPLIRQLFISAKHKPSSIKLTVILNLASSIFTFVLFTVVSVGARQEEKLVYLVCSFAVSLPYICNIITAFRSR